MKHNVDEKSEDEGWIANHILIHDHQMPSLGGRWHAKGVTDEGYPLRTGGNNYHKFNSPSASQAPIQKGIYNMP
jgi:hypothetical protein